MSMTVRKTKKSVIYEFDGYSDYYRAFVQGAFVGKFVVPKEHAHLVDLDYALDSLKSMHEDRRFGVILRGYRTIQ